MQKYKQKVLTVIMCCAFTGLINAQNTHVSKNGSDSNAGTNEAPFLTISKAANLASAGDTVFIHQGSYEETLSPKNSGAEGKPIVFQSYKNDRVIITAMQALSGWESDGGSIYKTKVDWNLGQQNMVMHQSTACDLARWPNNTDGNVFTLNSLRNDGGSGADEVNAYLTQSTIPDLDWGNGGSIFFYGDKSGGGWLAWKAWITNSSAGKVEFSLDKNPSWIRTYHYPAAYGDFYLEGIKEALDYENEWCFDENDNMLYIQIPGGKSPADGDVQMRRRELTIDLNGNNYVEVMNLAVFGGGIEIEGKGNRLYGVSSFYGNTHRGVFNGFKTNNQSIKLGGENNIIEQCEIAFGSGSGIASNESNNINNSIINCSVHDFNWLGCYDAPMSIRGGSGTLVKNNNIYNGGRDGIQITTKNSEVAHNDIHNSNLIADDCALLYTLGAGLNMKIHHNWFHDNAGRGALHKAAGIYLDNDAGNVDVYNNVVWNTEWTNIQINWNGTNINIFNNTLFDGNGTMGAWHKEGTEFTNVKVWNNLYNKGPLEEQSDKQNNFLWPGGGNLLFTDMSNNDFTLKDNSMVIDKGREIDGYTDGFQGEAPDPGAYEYGNERWLAGITWEAKYGPTGKGCYGLPGEDCEPNPNAIKQLVNDSKNIHVYPNPVTNNTLWIKNDFDEMASNVLYSISSVDGKVLLSNSIPNSKNLKINMGDLKMGIYVLRIVVNENTYTSKIFKR